MVQHAQDYEFLDYRAYGISHFYRFRVTPEMLEKATIVPDGTVDIIFRCGQDRLDVTCYGAVLKMHTIDYASIFHLDDNIFGIRFLPGKAFLPGGYPIGSLTESSIPFTEICRDQAMMEVITRSSDFKEQIQLFLDAYIPDYQNYYNPGTRPFSYSMVDEITKVDGIINVNELSHTIDGIMALINATGLSTTSPLSFLILTGVIFWMVAYIVTHLNVLVLRKRLPKAPRTFKVPFGPVIPIIGSIGIVWMIYNISSDPATRTTIYAICGIIFAALTVYATIWVKKVMKLKLFKPIPLEKVMSMENDLYHVYRNPKTGDHIPKLEK